MRQQLALLARLGLTLANPNSHQVTRLSGIGDRIVTDASLLIADLVVNDEVSYQMWLDGSTDVYCRLRRPTQGNVVQSFGLNGLTPNERLQVRHIVWAAFGAALSSSEALVVDLYDRTDVINWDVIVAKQDPPPSLLPDLLVVRFGAGTHASGQPTEFRIFSTGV